MGTDISLPAQTEINRDIIAKILRERGRRSESWDLIERQRLPKIIAGLDDATQPASLDQAKRSAEILLGSYPKHSVDDPKIYGRAIVSVFNRFPAHVGSKAVDELTLKCEFLPTRAKVNKQCEVIMGEIHVARFIARRMLQEHDRRDQEKREQAERVANRKAFREKHGNKSPLDVLKAEGFFTKGNSKHRKQGE